MSITEELKKFSDSDNFIVKSLRDIIYLLLATAIIASIFNIAFGLWLPMYAVETGSMIPNIDIGDVVFIESVDRKNIVTYDAGKQSNYESFGDYGDVVMYVPKGKDGTTPIMHRAIYFVKEGEPMWKDGPPAPHSGYITKGDNSITNSMYDQQGDISKLEPIKKEWIKGVARYKIPILGYVSITLRNIF